LFFETTTENDANFVKSFVQFGLPSAELPESSDSDSDGKHDHDDESVMP
jgi:hypothetical protein